MTYAYEYISQRVEPMNRVLMISKFQRLETMNRGPKIEDKIWTFDL